MTQCRTKVFDLEKKTDETFETFGFLEKWKLDCVGGFLFEDLENLNLLFSFQQFPPFVVSTTKLRKIFLLTFLLKNENLNFF
jgi:hypothetical protein